MQVQLVYPSAEPNRPPQVTRTLPDARPRTLWRMDVANTSQKPGSYTSDARGTSDKAAACRPTRRFLVG